MGTWSEKGFESQKESQWIDALNRSVNWKVTIRFAFLDHYSVNVFKTSL